MTGLRQLAGICTATASFLRETVLAFELSEGRAKRYRPMLEGASYGN